VAALTRHNAIGDGRDPLEARLVAYRMHTVSSPQVTWRAGAFTPEPRPT
jgi:hypothetical protein